MFVCLLRLSFNKQRRQEQNETKKWSTATKSAPALIKPLLT